MRSRESKNKKQKRGEDVKWKNSPPYNTSYLWDILLLHFILFYFNSVLFYFILFCFMLFYFILFFIFYLPWRGLMQTFRVPPLWKAPVSEKDISYCTPNSFIHTSEIISIIWLQKMLFMFLKITHCWLYCLIDLRLHLYSQSFYYLSTAIKKVKFVLSTKNTKYS